MDTMPYLYSKSLTKDTTFSNYLLIVYEYTKLPRRYGMENITTEEIMDKLDILQAIFEKLDKFGSWDLEKKTDASM